jgi:hypothetical protein
MATSVSERLPIRVLFSDVFDAISGAKNEPFGKFPSLLSLLV